MAVAEVSLESIDLTDYALYRHGFPHPVFTYLRREAPVWKHPDTAVLRDAVRARSGCCPATPTCAP